MRKTVHAGGNFISIGNKLELCVEQFKALT